MDSDKILVKFYIIKCIIELFNKEPKVKPRVKSKVKVIKEKPEVLNVKENGKFK